MSESVLDILNQDNSDVDLSMPLLPKGDFTFIVKKVEQVETKPKEGRAPGQLVKITLATQEPATSVKGEVIPPGTYVFDQISLTPTEKYSKDAIVKRCESFRQAVLGKTKGAFYPLDQFEGKVLKARVKVKDADGNYPAANAVAFYHTP